MGKPTRRTILALTLLAALAPIGPGSAAEDKTASGNRVAVRSFAAKGVDAAVASTVETSFCTALAADRSLEVVCPDDLQALLAQRQAQFGLGGCDSNEEKCLKDLAQLSQASRIVSGEVSRVGELFVVSATLVDARSGKVLARASEKVKKVEALLDAVGPLAGKLAQAK